MTTTKYDRDDSIGHLINYASRLNHKALRSQLPAGIQPSYLPVIRCLTELDGQTQSNLCARIGVEQPSMAEIIKRMEKDGFITRKAHEADGRQQRLFLTPTIHRRMARLESTMSEVNRITQAGIPEPELQHVKKALRKMIANLEAYMAADAKP